MGATNLQFTLAFQTDEQPSSSTITVYCDGLCEPYNPNGYGCWGWSAVGADGQTLAEDCGFVGKGEGITNNVAEYHALLNALRWAVGQPSGESFHFLTDSLLVVKQVNGEWACNKPHLKLLRREAVGLISQLPATLEWIPREKNERADALSRVAYQKARTDKEDASYQKTLY